MKFFHIADLHLGRMLYHIPLVEEDQPFWVEQFLLAVDEHQPDAVVIAGDIYDRKVPSVEAMKLFDHLITELAKRDKYVFVIPGNHDSSARLSHVRGLLAMHRIYIAGELERDLQRVTVHGEETDVTFYLMPYLFPRLAADERVLGRDDLSTYDEAARALLAVQEIDESSCSVLVAHQNVLANGVPPEHSESETIIGGLGEIECSAFDAFDYVALGHIHNAQRIGRETARYAGCPIYYDFSELNRDKALTLVNIHGKGRIEVERIEIPLKHMLRRESGTLKELLEAGSRMEDKEKYYIQCVLCDKYLPPRALEQLREVYGSSLVNVKRSIDEGRDGRAADSPGAELAALNIREQFSRFYQEQMNEMLDGDQEGIVQKILEQQSRGSGEFILDVKSIPREDSRELLDFLLQAT